MDNESKRDIEYRFVVSTEMTDKELELFLEELKTEFQLHLLPEEEFKSALWSNSISYESIKLITGDK